MFIINENLGYLSRGIKIIKKYQMKILGLENTITENLKIH